MTAEDWQPYLLSNEVLKWNGKGRFPAAPFISGAVLCFFFAAIYLYYALGFRDILDACGPSPTRACYRMYYSSWPSGILMAIGLAFCLYFLSAQSLGKITLDYAITDRRLLHLAKGLFHRGKRHLVAADNIDLTAKYSETSIAFRSSNRAVFLMTGLTEFDIERARFAFEPARTEAP